MVQKGPNDHFGQNDLIPNRILAFARPKRTKMVHFGLKSWDLPCHLQSPKPRKPEKSQKSLPRGVWDPPTPDPEKVPKRSEKSRENLKINYFLDFSNISLTFSGSGIGGSQTPLGRLSGFRGLVLCGWWGRSQLKRSSILVHLGPPTVLWPFLTITCARQMGSTSHRSPRTPMTSASTPQEARFPPRSVWRQTLMRSPGLESSPASCDVPMRTKIITYGLGKKVGPLENRKMPLLAK